MLVSGITSVCIVHDGGLFGAAAKVERMKQAKTEAAAVVDKGRQDSKVVGGGVTGVSIAGGVLVVSTALTADTVRKTPFLSHFMPNPPLKSAMTGSG